MSNDATQNANPNRRPYLLALGLFLALAAATSYACWLLYGPNAQRVLSAVSCTVLGIAMISASQRRR